MTDNYNDLRLLHFCSIYPANEGASVELGVKEKGEGAQHGLRVHVIKLTVHACNSQILLE